MKQLQYYIFAFIICIGFITESCRSSQGHGNNSLSDQLASPDSIILRVQALDLTEDMSLVSSKNDEVVILIYEVIDSLKQVKLVSIGSFVLTNQKNNRKLAWANSENLSGKVFSIVIVERDTEESNSQIESTVKSKYFEIKDHFVKQGNFKIEKYLSDNDIIGIKAVHDFDKIDKLDFEFSGFFKLDKYIYQMTLSKN